MILLVYLGSVLDAAFDRSIYFIHLTAPDIEVMEASPGGAVPRPLPRPCSLCSYYRKGVGNGAAKLLQCARCEERWDWVSESMRVHAVKPNYSTVDAFANVVTAYILIDVCVVWRSWCGGDIRDVFPRLG